AVTVRRPWARRMPHKSRGSRAALRRSSQQARATKALARKVGKYDNGMAGSSCARWGLTTVIVRRGPALGHPPATPPRRTSLKDCLGHWDDALTKSRKVQVEVTSLGLLQELIIEPLLKLIRDNRDQSMRPCSRPA